MTAFRLHPGSRPSPVVLAVPHAGRGYPADVLARARVPLASLQALEDRHAEQLIAQAVAEGAGAIVAETARAAIDLNRDEREIDLSGIAGPWDRPTIPSARVRGGLGLVPRRLSREGELWAFPLPADELRRRIATIHRPYHQAIAAALAHAMADHRTALLLDCHSMPSLPRPRAPEVVFGTLGGRSVAPRFLRRALAVAQAAGLRAAVDDPYAGGHTLDRHGRPALNRHALQLEVDRALYLQPDGRTPDPTGVARIGRFVADLVADLAAEAGTRWSEAAE